MNNFTFQNIPGVNNEFVKNRKEDTPLDFYKLFLDAEVISLIVRETNLYAEQQIINGIVNQTICKNSLLANWTDTNEKEMWLFIGIIIWMGLSVKPSLRDYWSTKIIYSNGVSKLMSRTRFETLLSNFHLSDNQAPNNNNRLYKISPLVALLNKKFQSAVTADENVCIDETMVPFRGRLSFKQYIPGKRHKYGIKLFKLCLNKGYTFNMKIYGGKEVSNSSAPLANKIVLELMQPLLNSGRTLFTDNFYTSVDLAHQLLKNKTHLVGTLRANRKLNPTPVTTAKLKPGEMILRQSNSNVIVGKWKDRRDVLFLTTKSVPELVDVQTRRGIKRKPSTIIDYNTSKTFIDVSDQKASYATPIRRSIKWYRKIAVEFLANTSLVNAHVLYEQVTNKKISVIKFREEITIAIFESIISGIPATVNGQGTHKIEEIDKRGRCVVCYRKFSEQNGRNHAIKFTKRVNTKCSTCEEKFLCMNCFFELHNVTKKQ